MKLYIIPICWFLVSLGMMGCSLFEVHPYTARDYYLNFESVNSRKRDPDSVEIWLNEAPDYRRVRVAMFLSFYGLCKSQSSSQRMKYAELYLKTYTKIVSGQYGRLKLVTIDQNGGVFEDGKQRIDIKKDYLRNPFYFNSLSTMYDYYGGDASKPNPEFAWLQKEIKIVHDRYLE